MKSIKCVVVGNDKVIRDLVCSYLALLEVVAEPFSDARDALEYVRENDVDIVVSDIDMPGMSGFDLLGHIETYFPDIVCVMMAGEDQREEALQRGAEEFIVKPFRPNDFVKMMEGVV